MPIRHLLPHPLIWMLAGIFGASVAVAAGEVLITQQGALQGGVTPGDDPGFPVTISKPGTYGFASPINVKEEDRNGIVIQAPDVTVDLNGFTLHGRGKGNIGIKGGRRSATIRNGTITGFKGIGVEGAGDFWIVEKMRIVANGGTGIALGTGSFARILRSTVAANQASGIFCGPACHIEGNSVAGNTMTGIFISTGMVRGNSIIGNGGIGLHTLIGAGFATGYGHNTLIGNDGGNTSGDLGVIDPNACSPPCP